MRKTIALVSIAIAVLASTGLTRAEEPKTDAAKKKTTVEERQKQRDAALRALESSQDADKALKILDEMIGDKEVSEGDRFKARCAQFGIWALLKKDGAKASALAKTLSEAKKDDAELLNELAWTLLDTADLKNRDLDLAMTIAKRAAKVSKHADGPILDTLARAYFEKGDLDKALEYQTKAVEKCKNNEKLPEEVKSQIKETLEKYQNKKAEKMS
jgi:tetratricopeptide (TPR) repeat protein